MIAEIDTVRFNVEREEDVEDFDSKKSRIVPSLINCPLIFSVDNLCHFFQSICEHLVLSARVSLPLSECPMKL